MPLTGISGSLAASAVLERLGGPPAPAALRRAVQDARRLLGPASSAARVYDHLTAPMMRGLGSSIAIVDASAEAIVARTAGGGLTIATGGFGFSLAALRRAGGAQARAGRWWAGTNGLVLRLMDATRGYARRVLDIDLDVLADSDHGLAILAALLQDDGHGSLVVLRTLVDASERHQAGVSASLRLGVESALDHLVTAFRRRRRGLALEQALPEALTVVYRVLFLLFAEARGLVPQWHPVYRRRYTIEALRPQAERGQAIGLWQSLQAITRLAHRGCRAGSLRVVPFNGRLFAPSEAPLAASLPLDDGMVARALAAVTTRPAGDRRERISYADLGVEQLGAVYEHVLDYRPSSTPGEVAPTGVGRRARGRPVSTPSRGTPSPLLPVSARSGRGARKRTGTFYTPRPMTEYLVRRALAPLTHGRGADAILTLRIVDPAMGSGAFLVAACRYLANAYEAALLDEGAAGAADISDADRAGFRRTIAQRCLYGVDINGTAVQLARLSLWLCTLAADKPLSFLDHHLRTGNSLVGAAPADILRQPPGGGRSRSAASLPLFDAAALDFRRAAAVAPRIDMALRADDSAAVVRAKTRELDALNGPDGPLAGWRALADGWCSGWFWPAGQVAPAPREWPAFSEAILGGASGLPEPVKQAWRDGAAQASRQQQFFHWELEFPEIWAAAGGEALTAGGFDAVIGNPPWSPAEPPITRFSRESGLYQFRGSGHANLYQLFADRMMSLVRPQGRLGVLMPSGLLTDHGCTPIRARLFERFSLDALLSFDNRAGLFPIHRGMRFALITATAGGATAAIPARFGLHAADVLDEMPDVGTIPQAVSIPLTLVRRWSGSGLAVPELLSPFDRALLVHILDRCPGVGDDEGWRARFGRELNATDDRPILGTSGLPVVEGKLLDPFRVRFAEATAFVNEAAHAAQLGRRTRYRRWRLGYREVASATNRRTLIAAMVPAGVVTSHTVFCLKSPADEDVHWFLCGVFNSLVANYLVRLRHGTHVPASAIERLPVPWLPRDSPSFVEVVSLSRRIAGGQVEEEPRLQALVARLYGCGRPELEHVLGSFPHLANGDKSIVLREMEAAPPAV